MKNVRLLLILGFLFLMLNGAKTAQASGDYCYYVPHVVSGPEYYPAAYGATVLMLTVTEDATDYEADLNGDGVYETQSSDLPAGAREWYYRTNWPSPSGPLATGASVRSNKPLHAVIRFGVNDFGTYDEGTMLTSLLPTHVWGDQFVVPVASTYTYVFAASLTQVAIMPPGQSSYTQTISPRTNIKLTNLPSGTKISSDNSVYVLGVNCQPDQNYPWMYNVLPISQVGRDYFYDASYGKYDITLPWPTDPKVWITAVNSCTEVYVDEDKDDNPDIVYYLNEGESANYSNPQDGAHIWSSDKVYVVYVENWAVPHIGKFGGAATEYIPSSSFGTKYALWDYESGRLFTDYNPRIFVVAKENDTQINLDFNFDGIDQSNVLNKGEVWTAVWPEGIGTTALEVIPIRLTSDQMATYL